MTYARGTEVSVEKSRAEIETILKRYGATHFAYMSEPSRAVIAFVASERKIRFDLPLPKVDEFRRTPANRVYRGNDAMLKAWEQGCREKWRALALCIKAKLESVEAKIETFESAFLAHVVMPDGRTIGETIQEPLAQVYGGNRVPLLPNYSGGDDARSKP
jgi:hypothetical protein